MSDNRHRQHYDVTILGSGLAGSIIAACLARNGVDVLVIDAGRHPRFAIGESTTPYTSMMMRLISERFGVPEIKHLATYESVQTHVTHNCGIKRNFGFVYHTPGKRQDPRQANEFVISKLTHTENHFFRQDVDQWMVTVARKYGAHLREQTRVTHVEFGKDRLTLTVDSDLPMTTKFLVDASGFRSPLATQLSLREEPTRLRTHSRSLFTHMVDVPPFEDTMEPRGVHNNPSPWSQGTLHHIFPGGWLWVIPFDNHPQATNRLCSVGLSLDPRLYPKSDVAPEIEFENFLGHYPDIRKQFAGARPVRNWVSTGRLQYSSRQTVGHRWCLTSHAAGFIDALFSRGLQNTMEIINALVPPLIAAVNEDDFSVERFKHVEHLEQHLLDFNDDLVANAYTSFQSWESWDAWFRVWQVSQILATLEVNRAYAKFVDQGDEAALHHLARIEPYGSVPEYRPVRQLLETASQRMQRVQAGEARPEEAAREIMDLLAGTDAIPPAFRLADPANRWYNATPTKVLRMLLWARRSAPPEIGTVVSEGLMLLLRKRISPSEYKIGEEVKELVAKWPGVRGSGRVARPSGD